MRQRLPSVTSAVSKSKHLRRMNKNNELTEDDQKDLETKVQKMTDKYIADIDKAIEEKTKEIMTV